MANRSKNRIDKKSTEAFTPDVPPESDDTGEVEVGASGRIRPASERAAPPRVAKWTEEGRGAAERIAGSLGQHGEDEETALLSGCKALDQVVMLHLGALPKLPVLERPHNAQQYLLAAIEAIERYADVIEEVAPLAMENLDASTLRWKRMRLLKVQAHIRLAQWRLHRLEGLESHLQHDLYGDAKKVYRGTRSAVEEDDELAEVLVALLDLFTKPAQEGVERRKDNEKIVKLTEEQTLERVREALKNAVEGAPATPARPAPAPDLPPLTRTPAGPDTKRTQ